jgi:5-methylcytosine-specific restriction endonuclease McrA
VPSRALLPCPVPGCGGLMSAGVCTRHGVAKRTLADRRRALTTTQRGYGAEHRRWRDVVIAHYPLCVGYPRGVPCPTSARTRVADHVIAIADGGDWTIANGQGLCFPCHARKSRDEHEARRNREPRGR